MDEDVEAQRPRPCGCGLVKSESEPRSSQTVCYTVRLGMKMAERIWKENEGKIYSEKEENGR
jgi:hypothetical protein